MKLFELLQTEPVRLWLYGVVTLAVLPGLALAGLVTGAWVTFGTTAAGVVLVVGPLAELVRGAVYSPASLRAAAGLPPATRGAGRHATDRDVTPAELGAEVGS